MPVYESASSRLHALLTALAGLDPGRPLRNGWSEVLGISEADVAFGRSGLPSVAKLISGAGDEARQAEERVGLPHQKPYVDAWSRPVYAPGANLDVPIHQQPVSPEALAYLYSVASVLQKRENHEALPDPDELNDLLAQVDGLRESVDASTELPDDVKRVLLRRIAQVRHAVENVRIGGAEEVEEAVELLLGAVGVRHRLIPQGTMRDIFTVALVIFAVFSHGPEVRDSLKAWPQVYEMLAPGPAGTHETDPADEHGRPADEAERAP